MSMRERKKIQKLSWEVGRDNWVLFFVWATVISSSWAAVGNRNPVRVQSISPTQRVLTFSFDKEQILALAKEPVAGSYVAQPFSAKGNVSYTVVRQNPVTVILEEPLPEITDTAYGLSRPATVTLPGWSGTNGVVVKEVGVMRGEKIFSILVRPYDFNPGTRQLTYYRTIKVSITSTRSFPSDFDHPDGNLGRRVFNKVAVSAPIPTSSYIRLVVNKDGIYHITGNDLDAAGVNISGFTAQNMTLWNHGKQVPIYIYTAGGNRFSRDSYFEFYGTANRVDYSDGRPDMYLDPFIDDNVYFLTTDSTAPPQRLVTESGALGRVPNAVDLANYSFTDVAHLEQDKIFERLDEVDLNQTYDRHDHWFWTEVSSNQMVTVPFYLAYPDTTNIQPLTLTAAFHGITHLDGEGGYPNVPNENRAELFINQSHVLSTTWDSQTLQIVNVGASANVPQNVLHHGANNLQIYDANPGNIAVATFAFNWLELRYQRLYVADKDYLKFTVPDNAQPGYYDFLIQNFSGGSISVYRLNDSRISDVTIRYLNNQGTAQGYAALFQAYVQSPNDQFIAVSDSAKLRPVRIEEVPNLGLSSHDYAADYVIVTSRRLDDLTKKQQDPSNPVNQLASWYNSHGTKTLVVDGAEVYDDFNYGIKSPYAIKDFVSYAYHNWSVAPRYVLLAGGGTWNTKTASDSLNQIPVMMVQTYQFGAAASDNFYACVDGDDPIPDVAIGRIPAVNADQMKVVVDKILSYYSNNSFGWQNTAMLIAGEEEKFHVETDSIVNSMLPRSMFVKRLYTSVQNPAEDTKYYGVTQDLLRDFNQGAVLVNYMGHGGGAIWADNGILTNDEVANMSNAGKYPFVTSMTCFTGAFDGQMGLPLMSTLLFAKNKGAVGAFASTGLGWMYNDFFMDSELLPAIFDSASTGGVGWDMVLGKANYYASYFFWVQAATMVNQYNLLGDPALRLNLPADDSFVRLNSYTMAPGQNISGNISNGPGGGTGTIQITNQAGDVAAQADITMNNNGMAEFSIPVPDVLSGTARVKAYAYNSMDQSAASADFSVGGSFVRVSNLGITSSGNGFHVSVIATASSNSRINSLVFTGKVYTAGGTASGQMIASLNVPLSVSGANEYSTTFGLGADTLKPGYVIIGVLRASLQDGSTASSSQVAYTVPGAADLSAYPRTGYANVNSSIKVIADSVVRLEGTVYDWNSMPAREVRVDFYDGSRNSGKFLGSARVSFDTMAQAVAGIPVNLPPGNHSIYMYLVFDSLTVGYDLNPQNNYASANINVDLATADSSGVVVIDSSATVSGAAPGEIFRIDTTSPALYDQPFIVAAKDSGGIPHFYEFSPLIGGQTGTYTISIKLNRPDSATNANLATLRIYAYDPRTRTLNLAGGYYSGEIVTATVPDPGIFTVAHSTDHTPPEVTVSVGDQFFTNGDFVPPNPRFFFLIHDEDGVNLNKKSMDVQLDGQPVDPSSIILPDTVSNPTSVTATVELPVKTGSHTLEMTARDANGNISNPVSAGFVVRSDFNLRVYGAYPDPFIDKTFIAFEVTSGNPIDAVSVKIYSVSGRLVKTIRYPSGNPAETIGLLEGGTGSPTAVGYHEAWWDGTDNYGNQVANGVYFYKIGVSSGGKTLEDIGKMARLR